MLPLLVGALLMAGLMGAPWLTTYLCTTVWRTFKKG